MKMVTKQIFLIFSQNFVLPFMKVIYKKIYKKKNGKNDSP